MTYRFERATTAGHIAAVQRLTNSIFAGELGQYAPQAGGAIIDKFHEKNTYWVALAGDQMVGMIALHDQAPFSAAEKLADPTLLEQHGRLAEIRLLAVEPAHRNGQVMMGLMNAAWEYARGHDAIVISGHLEKAPLYRKLGFVDLGPPVRVGQAEFIPMIAPVNAVEFRRARWLQRRQKRQQQQQAQQ